MPTFPATSAVSGGGQITLMEIEQEVARRTGPYAQRAQSSVTVASTSLAYFDDLKTNANLGGITDLYLLRRGYKSDGTTVTVAAADRQRVAATYEPLTGAVGPDRLWTTPPVAGELVEFIHLDPANELRKAVQAGLRRCFFEDRAAVTLSGAAAERDLTAALFWVAKPTQLRRVQFAMVGSTSIPEDQDWWKPFETAGHTWLAGFRDAYPNTLYVTALRSHATWVNGADSTTGPTADADLLSLDLDYAAAAGHIEAWRIAKPRLLQAAAAGFQDSQESAAAEFTRQSGSNVRPKRREFGLSAPYGNLLLSSETR